MTINSGALLNAASVNNPIQAHPGAANRNSRPEIETQPEQSNAKEQLSTEDAITLTSNLNKMLQLLDADLRFALHEATQRLMVQVVDTKEQKVLKEFPPHELLDVIAKIRNHIGSLLDKKA